jgi:DNA polymerase alpha subunit A
MYGCLGFSHSRFYAQPIAALITAMGRETLQRTVTIAQETIGLDVIYGDTDSIMINTRIPGKDLERLSEVHELGTKVKREVNRLYKTLELEMDGVFRSMLLLKKKKYAAVTITNGPDGCPLLGKEMKGLDLVRRDWCIESKETGKFVLDQILSGLDKEEVVSKIHDHLENLAKRMRSGELPLEKFVITKGLSKHPDQYPDGKSQPHVQVAKMMLKANRPVNTGDHIPYVITKLEESTDATADSKLSPAERARHPEEIQRSGGALKPDVEWYLSQQILPPISRLCEPIEGTSQSIIADKLGLDASRFNHSGNADINDDALVEYTPASALSDEERFKKVDKLCIACKSCQESSELKGVFKVDNASKTVVNGFRCPGCKAANYGYSGHYELMCVLNNKVRGMMRQSIIRHGRTEYVCEDTSCQCETRQHSVIGNVCLSRGCRGLMKPVYSAQELDTQIKYLKSLFDIVHCQKQIAKKSETESISLADVKRDLSKSDLEMADAICQIIGNTLSKSAYDCVDPSLFQRLFTQ